MINNDIVTQFEQILRQIAGKGTDLALCDLWNALASNHFSENRGAIFPAVEAYLTRELDCPDEIKQRVRRAAKALSTGSYSLKEMTKVVHDIFVSKEEFEPTIIQGFGVLAIDFVGYIRPNAKSVQSMTYSAKHRRAVPGIPFGVATVQGACNGYRVAIPRLINCPDITKNDVKEQHIHFYKEVSNATQENQICVADAGFSLARMLGAGISNCVVRLSSNATFGSTPGKIPERKPGGGRTPTIHKPEKVVRPLARKHKENIIEGMPADEITCFEDEEGNEVVVKVWRGKYLLESHLKNVAEEKKEELRVRPINLICIEHPSYEKPHLYGTDILELLPENVCKVYNERWPVEGVPQVGKRLLSGGGGRHFTHCENSNLRLPIFSMLVGAILKFIAATLPPIPTGFWDRKPKSTFGRLTKRLKKVGLPLSSQLFKKNSQTKHLPVGYEARLAKNENNAQIDPFIGQF